jgi:hypothetical protein
MLKLVCPNCGSDNTQKLSLAVEGGTFKSGGTTFGLGGAGRSAGVFAASSKGSSTSKLAEKHAAPEKLPVIGGFFAIMVVAVVAAVFVGGAAIQWGFWVGIAASILSFINNVKNYPKEFVIWDAKYLCLRCSEVYTPEQAAVVDASTATAAQ